MLGYLRLKESLRFREELHHTDLKFAHDAQDDAELYLIRELESGRLPDW